MPESTPNPAPDGTPEHSSRVVGLWMELSAILWTPREGESVVQRLATPPWESTDPLVLALWDKLTVPEHELELAVLAAQDNINPTAREYFLAALEACRKRRQEALDAPPPAEVDEESGPSDPFTEMDRPLPE